MIAEAIKRDIFKKILSAENVYETDIRTHYIKMPKSIYSYLNTKNKYEIFNFGLEEHIPIDELISADELIDHSESKSIEGAIAALLYINHYINNLNHDDLLFMVNKIMEPYLLRLNKPFISQHLVNKKEVILNIIKHLGLDANCFFIKHKYGYNSDQYSFINLVDVFGMITMKHKELFSLEYDVNDYFENDGDYFEDVESLNAFKAQLPDYNDHDIKGLLDHGFRFSDLNLYDTFDQYVSPELKKQIETLRLLDIKHTDIISFLQNPIEKVDIQDMQII